MEPVLPAHGGACVDGVVPALLAAVEGGSPPAWLPSPAASATQVMLLVLDGLGWEQLRERGDLAPTLAAMDGDAITSVVPTTTATALTSITTGCSPAEHGVVGYRMHVGDGAILNVLRWTTEAGDARELLPPASVQSRPAFRGRAAPAVIRAEFLRSGFSAACLPGARLHGWRVPSTLVVEATDLLRRGEPFVYGYYDGVDRVAHEFGLGRHYDAELAATDRLVADLIDRLPAGAALVVTADHGQVDVGRNVVPLAADIVGAASLLSGEGRFRWLHAGMGGSEALGDRARERYGDIAWVRTRAELENAGWFGGPLAPDAAQRLGDVALIPFEPVAFTDPADTGDVTLVSRHGSVTPAEMWVPLLAAAA